MKKIKLITLSSMLFACSTAIFGQSITPLSTPFIQGEPMTFAYSGASTTNDWIGIYAAGVVPDGDPYSLVWKYVPTAPSGQVTFPGSLPIGAYDIHLFCCDPSYDIIASYPNFQIAAVRFRSRLTYYKESDDIIMEASEVVPGDVVSIYHASDFSNGMVLPGAIAVAQQTITVASGANPVYLNFLTMPSGENYVGVLSTSSEPVAAFSAFEVKPLPVMPPVITRFGVGSCGLQSDPQPTLGHALSRDIDFFLFLGDNLYIDTYDTITMREKYEYYIKGRTETQLLRTSVPLYSTWDDHDYGCCDEDADYPYKVQSQKMFLDFWDEPANSPRRTQEGIYASYYLGPTGQKLQVILLDTRYFESEKNPNNGACNYDYCPWPITDTTHTILGAAQWAWLKTELQQPADLRLIVSSIQFSASYLGWESWTLFPQQLQKMQDLLIETQAEHAFFISGDAHYSDVSKNDDATALYPLYDFTSSAINRSWSLETNANRVGNKVYFQPNICILEIDWQNQQFTFKTINAANTVQFEHTVPFEELEFETDAVQETGKVKQSFFKQIPAPGKGAAILVFEEKMSGEIALHDITGRAVRQLNLENAETIEIPNLAPGIYVAEFRGAAGVSILKVLVE